LNSGEHWSPVEIAAKPKDDNFLAEGVDPDNFDCEFAKTGGKTRIGETGNAVM
jgi:hypothetical protein